MSLFKTLSPAAVRVKLGSIIRARRTRQCCASIAAFIALFGLFGFFAAPHLIHRQAEQQLSQLLSRPVSIGRIAINPYTLTVEADQIHIGERGGQGGFIDLGELLVRGSWTSLFRLEPVLREVFLARLHLHIVRIDAQRFNFSDLVDLFSKPSAQKNSKPALFSISNIHMDDGAIAFEDGLLGQRHSVDKIELSIPFIANLPSKVDVFSQPMLQARVDGSPLLIEGQTKPFNGSFDSDVRVKLDQLDLPQLMSYAPTKLPVQLPQGKLSTDLAIRFSMSSERASIQISGTLDLSHLSLIDMAAKPLFQVDALHIAVASAEPLLGVVRLADVRIDHPLLALSRDQQGILNLQRLAQQPATPKPTPSAAAAAKPAPFDFSLQHLALNDGSIRLQDQQTGASLGLGNLTVTLADLSTTSRRPGRYTVQTVLDQGGSISSSGSLYLAEGRLDADADIEQLALAAFQPYLATALKAHLRQGTAGAKLALKADWSGPVLGLQIGDGSLRLDGLRLEAASRSQPVIALDHAAFAIRDFDLAAHKAELASIEIEGLAVDAERSADGSINLTQLAANGGAAAAAPAASRRKRTAPKSAAEQPWKYSIDSIDLSKSTIAFVDRTQPQPVSIKLSPLQLRMQHLSSDFGKAIQLDASAGFKRGTLKLGGTLTPAPLQLALQVEARQLDVAALEPFFAAQLNASIASALLNFKGDLNLAGNQGQFKVNYKGDAGLSKVRMLDKATSDLFAGWRSLDLARIKADYGPLGTRVDVGTVTLDDFYSRILLNSNGRLNLDDLVVKENAPAASLTRASPAGSGPAAVAEPQAATAAASSTPPLKLGFGQILLHRGKIDYTDNFIKPNFNAHLINIEGKVGAFGSDSTQPAPVTVQATLNDNGPVSIDGTVNPLVKPAFLDMTATSRDVDLSNFSSYSLKYAGYPIVKGKLNVDLHYLLDQGKLNANNHIFIDQFTFGDHVDNATATNLPVRLAISLLKNSRGEIDVNIPVSGSLDDPQFSVGSLLWHALVNLIEKAVSSPFSLLAGAFGGSEELGYVAFDAGSATLSAAEANKLDTLSKALADKPGVKLDLTGRADPALDTPGLKQASVDRQLKSEKIRDLVGKGESIDIDSVTLDPDEYDKYLARAYADASIKKPRNFIGIAKTVPAEQMKQLLLDNTQVSDADLTDLAEHRANAVQRWFAGKVDAGRIFTVAPKIDAGGISDKGPSTRVQFTLK